MNIKNNVIGFGVRKLKILFNQIAVYIFTFPFFGGRDIAGAPFHIRRVSIAPWLTSAINIYATSIFFASEFKRNFTNFICIGTVTYGGYDIEID